MGLDTDILIIGAGPAGMQAAIHASRRGAQTTMVGKMANSKLGWAWVENLFCVLGEVSGKELLEKGREQAERFGVRFIETDAVSMERRDDGTLECQLEDGETIRAKALILSTGITRNKSKIEGERDFIGKGISYCADCDGPLYRQKRVAIVGGESAAFAAAQSLLEFASGVILVDPEGKMDLERREELGERGVEFVDKEPKKVAGDRFLERLYFEDGSDAKVDGVFIEMGSRGLLELAMPLGVIPDERGFVQVDRSMATDVEGVFACGDITGPPLQVCKAIGEGCVAGLSAVDYVRKKPH